MDYIDVNLEELNKKIDASSDDCDLIMQRAILYYKQSQLHHAYNDIVTVLEIEPNNHRALHYSKLIKMLMNFEYKENINV